MKPADIRKIAVIGSGAMGHGIAQICASAGYKVVIKDISRESLDSAIAKIRSDLEFLAGKGKIPADAPARILSENLSTTLDTSEAVNGADIIIEAVPEIMELKEKVLTELSSLADKDAIIATNTSTMSISALGSYIKNPVRFAGMHFFNPVPRMKLVEVIYGGSTSGETADLLCGLSLHCDKIPVKVIKDRPGFIVNRINAPNQALLSAILDEGIIKPEQIDSPMKKLGIKMAPFETADFVGLDVFCHTLEYYAATLSPQYKPGQFLSDKIKNNKLGMKSGEGIYRWSSGKAQIEDLGGTDLITPVHFIAIQINEAVKVLKEGVAASVKDIDDAVKFGMNSFAGPFALAAGMQPEQIASSLNTLANRYRLEIFRPEPEIIDGSFKAMK